MRVNFLTSGFPHGFTAEFIRELKRYLGPSNRLAFVASDFAAHDKTGKYADMFVRWFGDSGVIFDKVSVIDGLMTPESAAAAIEQANVVWLAGGPPLTQISDVGRYGLLPALRNRDGITIGMSAGSINMARRVVWARNLAEGLSDVAVYDGIGLVDLNIEPHIDTADAEHLADVEQAARIAPIWGLPDGSFIVDIDGKREIFGPYRIYGSEATAQ